MSGSVIRNAIVDLRRMTLRSAKRRRPPPAIESASTAASTMLTLLCGHRLNHMSRAQRGSLARGGGEGVRGRHKRVHARLRRATAARWVRGNKRHHLQAELRFARVLPLTRPSLRSGHPLPASRGEGFALHRIRDTWLKVIAAAGALHPAKEPAAARGGAAPAPAAAGATPRAPRPATSARP